jgi:hypothetical protein
MQIDAGFHAAKGSGHVIHNIVDELIEIENRRDLLRRFLQLLEIFYLSSYLVGTQGSNGNDIGGAYWGCSHEIQPSLASTFRREQNRPRALRMR